jgi:hypothetical protein
LHITCSHQTHQVIADPSKCLGASDHPLHST